MSQKQIFLNGEGDNWFHRNKLQLKKNNLDTQFLISNLKDERIEKFLEVGCSSGLKSHDLAKGLLARGWGIDPSALAIKEANAIYQHPYPPPRNEKILEFNIGTSDNLEFKDDFFDLIYFAFCLYLVDRDLLSKTIIEADRCLRNGGFLGILDFDPGLKYANAYAHLPGLSSFKDDYPRYFQELGYQFIAKEFYNKGKIGKSQNIDDQTSITILQKP
jgi:ubiquinone/menaquinone biosynthesis C-methylase UbiE